MGHADRLYAVGLFRALSGDNRDLLLHLLECSRCRLRLQTDLLLPQAADAPPPAQQPAATGKVLDQALARQHGRDQELTRDFEQACSLVEELMELPPEARDDRVDSDSRFHNLGVARRLLAAAEGLTDSPQRSQRLASLVLSVAERLPPAWIESEVAAEVQARAWCLTGEARRLLGDLVGAEDAFLRAMRHLAPEPLISSARALLCGTLARLRYSQDRSDEALGLVARAIALLEEMRDFSELTEALADQGWFLVEEGETESALSAFLGGMALVDPRYRPRTALRLRHGLALCYCELGQPAKAHKLFAGNGDPLAPSLVDPIDRTRLTWIEAEVFELTGDLRKAIRGLELVFGTLVDLEAFPDAALAALHLARCYAEDRRMAAIGELRRRVESLWDQRKLPEMPATLLSFVLADTAEQGAGSLLDSAISYLERARHNPDLEFHPRETPSSELVWNSLDIALRQQACDDAKVGGDAAIRPALDLPIQIRHLISWTREERTGVRIVFSE